jgi:hypothetical protein
MEKSEPESKRKEERAQCVPAQIPAQSTLELSILEPSISQMRQSLPPGFALVPSNAEPFTRKIPYAG